MSQSAKIFGMPDGTMITSEKNSINTVAGLLDMLVKIAKIDRKRAPGNKIKNSSLHSEELIKLMDLHSKELKEISERME